MKVIYKYSLEVTDNQELSLPFDSMILSVANQNDNVVLYALVDTENSDQMETRFIRIFGTGNPIDTYQGEGLDFIGTVLTQSGYFVWHVFESE